MLQLVAGSIAVSTRTAYAEAWSESLAGGARKTGRLGQNRRRSSIHYAPHRETAVEGDYCGQTGRHRIYE